MGPAHLLSRPDRLIPTRSPQLALSTSEKVRAAIANGNSILSETGLANLVTVLLRARSDIQGSTSLIETRLLTHLV